MKDESYMKVIDMTENSMQLLKLSNIIISYEQCFPKLLSAACLLTTTSPAYSIACSATFEPIHQEGYSFGFRCAVICSFSIAQ